LVISSVGVIENDPALFVIEKKPDVAEKSRLVVEVLTMVQYNVVVGLLGIFVVLTLNIPVLPSLIDVGIVPNAYVLVRLVSAILTVVCALTVPVTLPVLILNTNASPPSVVISGVVVILKDPEPLVIEKGPEVAEKSPAVIPPDKSILQYSVVLERLVVVTLNVVVTPSLILEGGLLNDTVAASMIVTLELVDISLLSKLKTIVKDFGAA